MSSASGPSIATSGLVLGIDMSNTQKSWLGKPTTNLITNGNFVSGAIAPWDTYNVTPTVVRLSATSLPYTTFNSNVMQFTSTAGTSGASLTVTGFCTVGQAYTFSFYGRILSGASSSTLNFNNQNGSGDTNAWATSVTLTSSWQKFTFSFTYDVAKTTLYFYHAITGITSQFTEFQLEQSTFATPFTSTSRSTTQAIVDLTNNNTLTATSLTYASDNTFSFNGTNNYIDVTGNGFVSGMGTYTIMHWSRRDIEGRMPVASLINTAFYQYGDNSWKYMHGGVSGEYYYPHAVSIPLGTWGFYCIVYNGTNVSIYRNGIFEGSQATTGTADWSQGLKIGNWSSGSAYSYSGAISSVSFYNRALSASEVVQNFNAARSRYGL